MPTVGFASGFAVGFGSGFLTREVVTYGGRVLRPVVKSIVKTGVLTFERSREAMARVGETFDDVVAEAQAEIDESAAEDTAEKPEKEKKSQSAKSSSSSMKTAKGAT